MYCSGSRAPCIDPADTRVVLGSGGDQPGHGGRYDCHLNGGGFTVTRRVKITGAGNGGTIIRGEMCAHAGPASNPVPLEVLRQDTRGWRVLLSRQLPGAVN